MAIFRKIFHTLIATKCVWITFLAFVLPLKLLTDYDPELKMESKCAYVIIVMAVMWLTEAVPIPVTSLFPVFLFPMVGVAPARVISSAYFTDISMLLLGGLLIAMALEETRLHTRISLYVLVLVGAQPIMLMLGAMVTTWFLSFWINNTSATAMMIPIILAVCESVKEVRAQSAEEEAVLVTYDSNDQVEITINQTCKEDENHVTNKKPSQDEEVFTDKHAEQEFKALAKALCLSVAYGAFCGGMATITGTPPNLVLKDVVDKLYRDNGQNESPISFTSWIVFAFPLSLVTMVIGWLWLAFRFLGSSCFRRMDPEAKAAINGVIRKRAKALGPISFAETEVVIVFVSMVIFWLFRNPPNIDGWGKIFVDEDVNNGLSLVSDSTPCILLSTLLFILPEKKPNILCWSDGIPSYTPILKWQMVTKQLPWGVLILVGGGFAMARASQISGLSVWIGNEFKAFGQSEPIVLNAIILVVVGMVTEVMSNPATAQLFIPILRDMSVSVGINPLYLMITSAIACSFAFMLPVAAPPTAIVFATGYISIPDMALAGMPMKIIGIGVSMLAINTWGTKLFELDKLQDFLQDGTMIGTQMNSTLATTASEWLMGNETSPNIDSARNMTLI
ncbi:Na(+)/citrate cotransporter-like [Mya arenaria]|uniref:Na(+)/citrate cotransporter-like n=1 Tax=Mya arenaria TaxID=6604 RepID=UPI0022DFEDDE|nr:Na(+)/citrate cotransporter-like [Mya arenaria]